MRILLDECIPRKLARELVGHEATTISAMGWRGVKNGELLKRISAAGFDVMLTVDKNLEYQQNASQLPFAILVLDAFSNSIVALRPLIPACLKILTNCKAGMVYTCSMDE